MPDHCPKASESTRGDEGLVGFQYDVGIFGCLFGCGAEERMAVGSQAVIFILGDEDLPPFEVSSSDPDVITFSSDADDPDAIRAEAIRAGEAQILITDLDTGETLDSVTMSAWNTDAIEYSYPEMVDALTMMSDSNVTVGIKLLDEEGCGLVGVGSVDYEISGQLAEDEITLTDIFTQWLVNIFVGSIDENVEVEAHGLGEGQIEVTSIDGPTLSIPVRLVDETAATDVELYPDPEDPVVGESYSVSAAVYDGDEEIHDPVCAWDLSPSGGPISFDYQGRSSVELVASGSGSATITCTVGSAAASFDVAFP